MSRVVSRDLGARRLLKALASSGELTVGIHEADGAEAKDGDDGGDATLIDVAIVHEFGYEEGGIPRRSFIRDWVDESAAEHAEQERKIARAVVAGKLDVEQGLKRLGVLRQAEVQKRISEGIEPPLAQATIDRKGSSTPLINTGQLRGAISHKVTVKR